MCIVKVTGYVFLSQHQLQALRNVTVAKWPVTYFNFILAVFKLANVSLCGIAVLPSKTAKTTRVITATYYFIC